MNKALFCQRLIGLVFVIEYWYIFTLGSEEAEVFDDDLPAEFAVPLPLTQVSQAVSNGLPSNRIDEDLRIGPFALKRLLIPAVDHPHQTELLHVASTLVHLGTDDFHVAIQKGSHGSLLQFFGQVLVFEEKASG